MVLESYILVDSTQKNSGGATNSYTFTLNKVLKGVYHVELLSAAYAALTSCTHVVLDILEFRSPTNANGYFGIINNLVTVNSNVSYTSKSFYPLRTYFDNPFDVGKLTVYWRDTTGSLISMNDHSFLLKINHIK